MTRHIPVLLEEVKKQLHLHKGMIAVDATLGGGGHASMMLSEVLPTGRVIAVDTDADAIRRFRQQIQSDVFFRQASEEERLVLVEGNYSDLITILERLAVGKVDAILADLGFSSDQLEEPARGLSFQQDGPLDMRLNPKTPLTAREIVNTYEEGALARVLSEYGDEKESRRIARAIVAKRREAPLETTTDLASLIMAIYPKRRRALMKIHPATKTFQAIRIAVNQEVEHLESFLKQAVDRLVSGGRLAVITFHSGEDRRVKQFFKEQSQGCICPANFPVCRCQRMPKIKSITKKALMAREAEIASNPRARSAKLRVVERL